MIDYLYGYIYSRSIKQIREFSGVKPSQKGGGDKSVLNFDPSSPEV